MNHYRSITLISGALLAGALWLLSSSDETSRVAQAANDPWGRFRPPSIRSVLSGTGISVALGSNVSSETARVGDAWHGTVTEFVMSQNEDVISPGSVVGGVITGVIPADRGSCAMLELGVRSIRVNGHDESITASAEPVIAGSPRAHILGAIDLRTASSALIDNAVDDSMNADVGDLLGGAAADVVVRSNGHQVVLSDGTVMSFTVSHTVAIR